MVVVRPEGHVGALQPSVLPIDDADHVARELGPHDPVLRLQVERDPDILERESFERFAVRHLGLEYGVFRLLPLEKELEEGVLGGDRRRDRMIEFLDRGEVGPLDGRPEEAMAARRLALELLLASDADEAQLVTLTYLPGGDRPARVDLLLDSKPSNRLVVSPELGALESRTLHALFVPAATCTVEFARWGHQQPGMPWEVPTAESSA